jgi:hypothetical protein
MSTTNKSRIKDVFYIFYRDFECHEAIKIVFSLNSLTDAWLTS